MYFHLTVKKEELSFRHPHLIGWLLWEVQNWVVYTEQETTEEYRKSFQVKGSNLTYMSMVDEVIYNGVHCNKSDSDEILVNDMSRILDGISYEDNETFIMCVF